MPARGEEPARVPRVIIVMFGSPARFRRREDAFRKAMADLGYADGRNVIYEWRSANGQQELLEEHARDLAHGGADVVVSASTLATGALYKGGVSLPVVMVAVDDPVARGFARSIARPGANFTGLTADAVEHAPRFVELLSQAAGRLSRIAILANPENSTYDAFREHMGNAVSRSGARLVIIEAANPDQLDREFPAPGQDFADGLIVMNDPMLYNERIRIVELARDARRPVIYPHRGYAEEGGLMSYGPNPELEMRHAAAYVDRILKGAHPRDMAIQPPAKLELVVNRTAARGMGLHLPAEFLKKADRIIG